MTYSPESRMNYLEKQVNDLEQTLELVEGQLKETQGRLDEVYTQRAIAVAIAVAASMKAGWPTARRHDEAKNMWAIYLQTPVGQVSWHIADRDVPMFASVPEMPVAWDGKWNSCSTLFGAETVLNALNYIEPLECENANESNTSIDPA